MKFKPTYLYIKQHAVTGLLYFGKTTQNPTKYRGSGKYWIDHINLHGKEHVINIWCNLFENETDLIEFAEFVSIELDIVKSSRWANLKVETGIDGGTNLGHGLGRKHTEETKLKMRLNNLGENNPRFGKNASDETKKKMSDALKGHTISEETRAKLCLRQLGKSHEIIECPYCHKRGGSRNMKRYHFDNCSIKVISRVD